MEFSQIFGFLKIYMESIKLVLKNIRVIASITAVSIFLSSILFLLFSLIYHSASNSSSAISIVVIDLILLVAYMAIAHASWIATVMATATSYNNGRKSSLQEVLSGLEVKWTSPFKIRRPRDPMHIVWLIAAAVAVFEVIRNPDDRFTVAVAIAVAFACFISQLYTSVVWSVAAVVTVVEDGCEAVERAEKLVQGRRLDGFMANLLFWILCLVLVFGFLMIVGDQGSHNLTVYGLFFVNSISFTRIFIGVMYTVYYFRCREFHGEEIYFLHKSLVNHLP